jgi:hypothetical protein
MTTHEPEGGHSTNNIAVAPHFTDPEGMEGEVKATRVNP